MDLLRHWRRGTFGAAAGALVIPGAILLAALAVGVGGGGIAGLGALRQALTGPDLPAMSPLAQQRPARDSGRLLARVNRRAAAQALAARRAAARGGTESSPTPTPQGGFNPGGGTTPGTTPPAPTPPPTMPEPTPTPTSAVRQTGDNVTSVTDQVPVVGPPTSRVIDTVVDTVDALIPPAP